MPSMLSSGCHICGRPIDKKNKQLHALSAPYFALDSTYKFHAVIPLIVICLHSIRILSHLSKVYNRKVLILGINFPRHHPFQKTSWHSSVHCSVCLH